MRTLLLPLAAMVVLAPFANAEDWSSWKADDTYRGIEVRTRCTGYNEFAGRYLWDVQLRNRYQKRVDVTWAAEPQRLRGAAAQGDEALGVSPGETVQAHHTAPVDCSTRLMVRVNGVRPASESAGTTAQTRPQDRPQFQAHWNSRDPEESQKSLTVRAYGDAVTGQWSSPGFSFEITTPLPKNIHGSISSDSPAQK